MNSFLLAKYKEIVERLAVNNIAANEETRQVLQVCKDSLLQVQLFEPSSIIREAVVQIVSILQESINMTAMQPAVSNSCVALHQQNMIVKKRRLLGGGQFFNATGEAPGAEQDDDCDVLQSMKCSPRVEGLSSVIGLQDAKTMLSIALVLPCMHPQLFTGGRSPWSSVLLYGPPGTGKTRLAHAIAAEVGAELYCVSSAELLSRWVGESEKMVKRLFDFILKRDTPTVLFLDEVDGLCRKRQSNEEELSRRIKSQLLTALDCSSLQSSKTFVMGATNRPWDMDSAFLRRFQKKLYIPLPDRAARQAIMQSECADTRVQLESREWERLSQDTEGFSAAELTSLTKEALFLPVLELSHANYWRNNDQGMMEPCSRNAEDAVPHTLATLSPDQVAARDVTFADFQQAVRNTKRGVTASEMDLFRLFTDEFGQLK